MSTSLTPANPQRFAFEDLHIDRTKEEALFRQVETQLREAIWSGRLKPNERLPSTRQLSKELNVARNTIITAYEQLMVEGFLVSETGSGTRVAKDFPLSSKAAVSIQEAQTNPTPIVETSSRLEKLIPINPLVERAGHRPSLAFRAHIPCCKSFPTDTWTQLSTKRLRHMPKDWMASGNPNGYQPLREALSDYLGVTRGIYADPDQIIVTAGTQQSIDLLAKLLTQPGDSVCFEDPGYTPASVSFELQGTQINYIPIDEQGIQTEALDTHKNSKLVYVTPASQFPLGMTLSQSRRRSLLQWAQKTGAYIVEDDYNGEYRYKGRPLTTLYTMASNQQVIYLSSFSKLLYPGLRLGFMVVPKSLVQPLKSLRWMLDRHSPYLEQAVLTDFINAGHFARHLRRMRALYKTRQEYFIKHAEKYLGHLMDVPPLDGGLHLIGWLKPDVSEKHLAIAAKKADVDISFVSSFSRQATHKPAVIFGYAPYDEQEIELGCKKLLENYENRISENEQDEHFLEIKKVI